MFIFYIAIPIITALLAQASKIFTDARGGKFSFESFYAYGGMPSGHAAFVAATATVIGVAYGVDSPAFLLAIAVAVIIIRDAMTLRQYIGNQSKAINALITKLPDTDEYEFPVLPERVGHTPLQLLVGTLFGIVVSLLLLQLA